MGIRSLTIMMVALLTSASTAEEMGDAAAGETAFKVCASCHAVGEGARNRVGPVLNGVIDRQAGTYPDFRYSSAMVEAGEGGLIWTTEKLSEFLHAPKELVPGTRMTFAGIQDQAEIDNIIAYLKTLPGAPE